VEELTYSIWILNLPKIEVKDPRVKIHGSEVKIKGNWEGCLSVKEDITALSALPVGCTQESRTSPCLTASSDLGTGNRRGFSTRQGYLSWSLVWVWENGYGGDAGVPAVNDDTRPNGVEVKESRPLRTVLSQAPRVLFLWFCPFNAGRLLWRVVQPLKEAPGSHRSIKESMPWKRSARDSAARGS